MKKLLTEHVQEMTNDFERVITDHKSWHTNLGVPNWDVIKSHLLQSQLKTIELAKNELQRLMRDTLFDDCGICLPCINNLPCADKIKIHHENYGRSTAITLLDTIIQEVKVQI